MAQCNQSAVFDLSRPKQFETQTLDGPSPPLSAFSCNLFCWGGCPGGANYEEGLIDGAP